MSAPGPQPDCLPGCEEQHEEDCPVPAWEVAYWGHYFGLRPGMSQQERRNQLEAFRPPGNTGHLGGEDES